MRRITALLLVLTLHAAHAQSRPNFVIFIGDDISAADFGCYGHPSIKTPIVDGLAARGMRFTNAYLTAPSCSPSRTSLITARYPHNTGGPELHMKKDPHQVHNLAAKPEHAATLKTMRSLLAQWTEDTGDTTPPLEKMTPDRSHRVTGERIQKGGRPSGGVFPGQETKAWTIDCPGPIRVKE